VGIKRGIHVLYLLQQAIEVSQTCASQEQHNMPEMYKGGGKERERTDEQGEGGRAKESHALMKLWEKMQMDSDASLKS